MEGSWQRTSLEQFCGSTFWDPNLLDSPDPDVTSCFQHTVLVWIPCLYLWIVAPLYLRHLRSRNKGCRKTPRMHKAKTVFAVLLWMVMLLELFKALCEFASGMEVAAVHFVRPLHLAVTMALAGILIQYEQNKGTPSSGLLFVFWLLTTLCGAITARSKIRTVILQEPMEDKFRFATFCLYFTMVVLQLILSTVSEDKPPASDGNDTLNPSPEESSSFLSRVTFWWFTPLILLGYKRPLKATDLYLLKKEDTSEQLVPIFDEEWRKKPSGSQKQEENSHTASQGNEKSNVPLADNNKASESKDKIGKVSLIMALLRCFWPVISAAALFNAFTVILHLTSPYVLKLLISFTRDKLEHQWKGYLYTTLLLVVPMGTSLLRRQFIHRCFCLKLRMKTVVVSALYKKSLTVTSEARKSFTVGSITNLMSVDAQRVADTCFDLQFVWSVPLVMVGTTYLLWNTLGPAVLAGLAVKLLLVPVHSRLVSKMKELDRTLMEHKDCRIKLMNEVLNGIKVLKLYAWELSFKEKIDAIRAKELRTIQKLGYIRCGLSFIANCTPLLVSLVIFAVYLLTDETNVLDAEKAFVAYSLVDTLRNTFRHLPHIITNLLQAKVSLGRIENFLGQDDLDPDNVQEAVSDGPSISVHDGTFSWGKEEEPILKDINFSIPDGALVAVIGQIGSGKSSLLSALLGEMEKQKGNVSVKGSTAYVSQQPWIQNATLRDNVLFNAPMDKCRYSEVLEACALGPDLEILSGGDLTEIGEKGINLSGGQKLRVSLARALYSDAGVYYLDDPLSAVDPHVGRHIFDHVIGPKGMLKNKTRLLVTHGTSFLPQCDRVIVLQDGRIWLMGDYQSLMEQSPAFAEYINNYSHIGDDKRDGDPVDIENKTTLNNKDPAIPINHSKEHIPNGKLKEKVISSNGIRRRLPRSPRGGSPGSHDQEQNEGQNSKTPEPSSDQMSPSPPQEQKKGCKLMQEEEDQPGGVKLSMLRDYVRYYGVGLFITMCLMCCCQLVCDTYSGIWLSQWTNDHDTPANGTQTTAQNSRLRLGVFGALGLAQGAFAMLVHLCVSKGGVRSSTKVHDKALLHVLQGSLQFFDTTPLGRIMNRFSQDLDRIDKDIHWIIMYWIFVAMLVFSTFFVVSLSTPLFVVVLLPVAQLYYYMQRYYIATARQVRRLESKSRSHIYSHFGETLQGVSTIRAFNRRDQFVLQNHTKVDDHQTAFYCSVIADNWLAIGLDMVASACTLCAAVLAIAGRDSLDPGSVGLSISSVLNITHLLNALVHITGEMERSTVSLERMQEYAETPAEADWIVEDNRPPENWPDEGKVTFSSYQTRYREGLDLVIKDVTVNINSGDKIGIVGRTGAGKSSLVLAIFRIIEAAGGDIVIDGVNISKIGLHDLRSRLSVIPQDPVLFSGTLRMNLDPFEKHSNEEIWAALELSNMKDFVMGLAKQLEHDVTEGGTNLSVGQRQLVCLARALLRKSKLLVLDEATASVDPETDGLIQSTIRTQFADCTVLTIAHRLNTIMDSTRVLVLDGGKVSEFDTPKNLIASKGHFYSMVKDAGLVTQE